MHKTEVRKGRTARVEHAQALVRRAEWFSLVNVLGIGRKGGWTNTARSCRTPGV